MQYNINSVIPPHLYNGLNNKTYILPQWIEVPNDTVEEQIIWTKYESKSEPIIKGNQWKSEMGENKYNTRFDVKTNKYVCGCPGFWRVKDKGGCKHVRALVESQSV